jgi:hypothetical protein
MLPWHTDVLFRLAGFAHEHGCELVEDVPVSLVLSVELAMLVSAAPQLVHCALPVLLGLVLIDNLGVTVEIPKCFVYFDAFLV